MSADPEASVRTVGRVLQVWVARGVLAALLVALVDQSCVLALSPVAVNRPLSWVGALGLSMAAVLPVAVLLAVLVGLTLRWVPVLGRLPDLATNLAVTVMVLVAAVAIRLLHRRLGQMGFEFRTPVEIGLDVAVLFVLAVTAVAAFRYLHPWLRRRVERAGPVSIRALVAAEVAGLALAAVAGSHFGPAAAHDVTVAPVAGGAALFLLLVFVGVLTPQVGVRESRAVAALGLLVLLGGGLLPGPGARYLVYARAVAARPFLQLGSRVLDWDDDGAVPTALGGADCAPFDSARGPLQREIPGDGIDQDCRGGDAAPEPPFSPPAGAGPWDACLAAERARPLSLVIVSIDALRADAVTPELTPWLAPFIQRAAWFTRAYAPSTLTEQSMPTLFAGAALSDIGPPNLHRSQQVEVGNAAVARLREGGYLTAALTMLRPGGLRAAFEYFGGLSMDPPPEHGGKFGFYAGALTQSAIAYLRRARRPALVWVHYTDTHAPYVPVDVDDLTTVAQNDYERVVVYTTYRAAELLRFLLSPAVARDTVIVLTADHGEDLGERGRSGHGPDLFEATVRVPLGLVVPGCPPLVVTEPVSLVELAPTLLELAGMEPDGRTLLDTIAGRPRAVPVVAEAQAPDRLRRAVIVGRRKLLVDVAAGGAWLFDLEADPDETHDLYDPQSEVTRQLEQAYQRWLDR